jgi:hypothetical protein
MTAELLRSMRQRRIFFDDRRAQVVPFAAAYTIAFALYPFGGNDTYGGWFAAAALSAVATVVAIAAADWRLIPEPARVLPLLSFVASVAFLREAHGGSASGYAPLVLVPVMWAALFAGPAACGIVVAAVVFSVAVPPLVEHGSRYPSGEFRRAVLLLLVALLIGVVIQALVRAILAAEARATRIRAEEVHDDLVQAFAAAKFALDIGDRASAAAAVGTGLAAAQALSAEMLGDASDGRPRPGSLRRRG